MGEDVAVRARGRSRTTDRPGWTDRLRGWFCLLAVLFIQLLPPIQALESFENDPLPGLICHAGAPVQGSEHPDVPFTDCTHCPLCQILAGAVFLSPQPLRPGIPPPSLILLGRIDSLSPPLRIGRSVRPFQPRAPPGIG
jgi:hypothetical protein